MYSNSRLIIVIWFSFGLIFVLFSCNKVVEKNYIDDKSRVSVETIALDFLVNKLLIDKGLFEHKRQNLNLDTVNNPGLKELVDFNIDYYTDTVTCKLTSPGFLWDDGASKTFHSVTDNDYILLEKDYQTKLTRENSGSKINVSYPIEVLRWQEFLDKNNNGMFLNVRLNLSFETSFLVEINCIIRDQVDSSEIHTFYFFINDQQVYSWDYKEEFYFEELDFCGDKFSTKAKI